jgi:uncharacterized protein YdbL (DUF1318 family)
MKKLFITLMLALCPLLAVAQANLEINTPAINGIKQAMAGRHTQLAPHYISGAVGITRDGSISLRDANAVALPQRAAVNGLVGAENADRVALYKEIARANGKPEWEAEIRNTFAQRWIEKASPGWYVQNAQGQWAKK